MDWQGSGKNWFCDDSPEAEQAFRETLLRLEAQGVSNCEIAAEVMRSPFILGLVWAVTASEEAGQVKGRYCGRPPMSWEGFLARHDLRDEWRCETVYLLGRKCERDGLLGCDLSREKIGGFWRLVVVDKAVKAAWVLLRENCCKVRKGKTQDHDLAGIGGESKEGLSELYLELADAISELENPRQRAVMRLFLLGHDKYQEIADRLTEQNGLGGKEMTYEMVRFAFEKARKVLREKLRRAA